MTAPATPTALEIRRPTPHVAEVWLNRPDVRNAFNDALITELAAAFDAFARDDTLRAVVLGGHGKAFCAGADLNWMRTMADYDWERNRADAKRLADMLWTLWTCPVPVVARLHGDAFAGGVGLAAACDIRVAAEGVQFCLSEARLGLLPATIAPYVVRALGEAACRRYFTTAERFDAATALRLGFVHEVTPTSTLDAKVNEIVAALVAGGPMAVRACKRLVRDVAAQPITAELRDETARRIADIRASEEGREGVQAFLGKRDPAWRN
jgi:methylglutaconyl-CoA hydratase